MPRTTQDTVQALERLTDGLGWDVTRDGRRFLVHVPGTEVDGPPLPKTSARALALAVSCCRHLPEWEAVKEATAYDPGQDRTGGPDLPSSLAAWEEHELTLLWVGGEDV